MAHAPARAPLSGVAFMLVAWFAFSLQDAIVKTLARDLPVAEILFGRSIVVMAMAAFFIGRAEIDEMRRPATLRIIAFRSMLTVAAWLAYFGASRQLQLDQLVTFYFAAPLFVTALARPVLGERVSWVRWSATLGGFAGVVFAADPAGAPDMRPATMAIFAALAWGLATVLARHASANISTRSLMVGGNVSFALVCGAIGIFSFKPLDAHQALWLLLLGVNGGFAQFLWFEGVSRAQASLLAPIEYSLFAFAIFWGFVFFGDLPAARTLEGAAVVLACGALALAAEARRKPAAPLTAIDGALEGDSHA